MAKTNLQDKERELPEVLEISFVICDNTLNRNGWRLLVEGIDYAGFLKNPVCCFQHNTYSMPIGKWKDLKIENEQFSGTVEFDKNDTDAVKVYWKCVDGFMSACSLNILPLSESESKEMLMPGQRYATVTSSELLEVSIVTLPGQKNAVKLSNNSELKLSANDENINPSKISNKMDGKEEEKNKEKEELKKQLEAERERSIENLIQLHVARKVVQVDEVEHLKKLASADYDTVSKMLSLRKEPTKENDGEAKKDDQGKELLDAVQKLNAGGTTSGTLQIGSEKAGWTYMDWFKKDPKGLELMAKNNPEKFKKLETVFAEESKSLNIVTK